MLQLLGLRPRVLRVRRLQQEVRGRELREREVLGLGVLRRLELELLQLRSAMRRLVLVASIAALTFAARQAAAADSERGPFYVQAHVAGASVAFVDPVIGLSFPLELHGGYHFSGRHDGFVVGLTQRIGFGSGVYGMTLARIGWDIPIPVGRAELTIAPYVFGGAFYPFGDGDAGAHFGAGGELRIFPLHAPDPDHPEVVRKERRVVLAADHIDIKEKIQFRPNEAVIDPVSYPLLDEIAAVIKENPQIELLAIEGHASSEGDPVANEKLSDARAHAVRQHLIDRGGVKAESLDAKGYGASRPIATNDTPEGRESNRRVEFNIVKQSATVEKVVVDEKKKGGGAGFFIVVKPIELGFTTGQTLVTSVTFQAGVGFAF